MFTYKIATTDQEREQTLELVQESYRKVHTGSNYRASISAPYFSEVEEDTILLYYNDLLVGTVSFFHHPTMLPSEFYFGLKRPVRLHDINTEIGRLAKVMNVALPHEVESAIFPVLLWLCAVRLTQQNIKGYVCTVKSHLYRKFQNIGFQPERLSTELRQDLPSAVGDYLKDGDGVNFLYCDTLNTYGSLQRMGLDKYLTEGEAIEATWSENLNVA